jgi:hypothetical protein
VVVVVVVLFNGKAKFSSFLLPFQYMTDLCVVFLYVIITHSNINMI